MGDWRIVDKQTNPEEYQPILCDNNDVNSNFSISIIAVLENSQKRRPVTPVKSCIRLPFVCTYFDNILLAVVTGEKCQLRLLKIFKSNIKHVLILNDSNTALVLFDNGDIFDVNLSSGQRQNVGTVPEKEAFLFEQNDGSIIVVNQKGIVHNHYLLSADRSEVRKIPHEDICDDSRFSIELILKRTRPVYLSSLCMNTALNRITAVCPITGQSYILNESINAHKIEPFENNNKVLFLQDNGSDNFNLHIATCFNLNVQLTTGVSKNCVIVGGIGGNALYADFTKDKLYVCLIQEISPMSQLEILISLRNYEAAELFAKTHNLSPIAVLEIKAKCLVNNLKKEFSEDLFKELTNVLSSCDNINFIVNCCIDGVETNSDLWPLLEFAKKKMLNCNDINLNLKIDKLLWKIEVYRLFGTEKDVIDWKTLIDENPVNICKKLLNNDLLDHASVVWLKSYRFIYNDLKINDVVNMLCSISHDVKLSSLLWWLEYFIPNVIGIIPHVTDLIIDWAKDRICVLENSPHWPEIGVQFAEKFANLMFNAKGIVSVVPASADKIYSLIKCMKQIHILKKTYNIIVSLRDFTTLSSCDLAKFILRKAFNEDVQALFSNYLDNFMIRHNLNHDGIIREYIEELLGISPSIDEQRMLTLIDNIFNIDEKYQCIILVLKSASIPWSSNMKKISQEVIESRHPLSVQVHAERLHADIKSILVKYKCLELSSEDYNCVISLIIEKEDSEMMHDIEKITQVYSSLKEDAFLLCITKLVEKGNIISALDVYGKMDDDFKEICYHQLSVLLEEKLKYPQTKKNLERNYLDFLKCIGGAVNDYDLDCFDKILILKNKFQLYISLEEYYVKDYRKYFLSKWCQEKTNDKKCEANVKELLLSTVLVGSYLSLNKTECVSVLISCMNKSSLQSLAEIIMSERYFLDKTVDSLPIIVDLIPLLNLDNATFIENALFSITAIIQNCKSKHLPLCLEVHNWLKSIHFAHSSTRKLLGMWKISPFYNPQVVNSIIPIWKEAFYKNHFDNFEAKVINLCCCPPNKECRDGSQCLQNLLNKLQQNDIYSMKIIAHCTNWHLQNNLEIPGWLSDVRELTMQNLITRIITNDKPDHLFISNLMLAVGTRDEWLSSIFDTCGYNTKKIHFAKHILNCKNMYQYSIVYKQAYNINLQCNIENKLESYGLMLKNNQDGSRNLISLLESLVNVKSFNVEILQEYCLVSNINVDNALTAYLLLSLRIWQNDYKFINYTFDNCKIISNIDMHEMLENCLKISSKIICKDELIQNLITLFRNGEVQILDTTIGISRYCYEAYLIITDLLKNITGTLTFLREYLLLKFLQTYQRIDKPKQTEIDEFSLKETFPKIGFYRLPFHFLISENFWNNLKPEVTLATYKQWLPVAGLLLLDDDIQVSCDKICSNAVRQSMAAEKMNKNTNITWCLYMKNKRLLEEAHKCIENISNLEWAGACFYYVYQCSPFGADQVAAADFCYQFAEHWAKIEPNNNAVRKMQMKHLLTSSAHILHKYNLAEDKLLSLCDNPHKLIEALYNHRSILTNYECSDINNAVIEIAEKHNLNSLIKMQIFSRILGMSNSDASMSTKCAPTNDGTLNKELLMRACYILKDTNLTATILYLHRITLNVESMENYNKAIRALQCLLSLADDDLLMKNLQRTTRDIWSQFWDLYFINALHLTGHEYLLSFFNEDKVKLVEQMCTNTRDHSKSTVVLLIKMIFVYNIKVNDTILDELCKCVLKFNLFSEVREFLLSSRIIFSSNYITMWNNILLAPFKVLDSPVVEQQKNECCETLRLLPMCPILSRVDLSSIVDICIRLNISEFAMMILPYLSDVERKKTKSKIGKIKKSTLEELKVLKSKGIPMTNAVMAIMKQS